MPPSWLGTDATDPRGVSLFAAYGMFVLSILFFSLGRALGRRGHTSWGWVLLLAANPVTVGLPALTLRFLLMEWAPVEFGQSCFFHPFAGWLAYAHTMRAGIRLRGWTAGLLLAGVYSGTVLGGGLLLAWWTRPL